MSVLVNPYRFGVSGAFDPTSISGLQIWLDGADANTLYDATSGGSLVAADGTVARWEDKSGGARHVTQGTSGNRPTRKTSIINGRDVLRFNGSSNELSRSGLSISTYTIFAVYDASATDRGVVYNGASAGNGFGVIAVSGTRSALHGGVALNFFGTITTDPEQVTTKYDGTTSVRRVNGSGIDSSASGLTSPSGALTIGSTNASAYFSGDIAEILIYEASLSVGDTGAVESYLLDKWGI